MQKTGFMLALCMLLLCLSACSGNKESGSNDANSNGQDQGVQNTKTAANNAASGDNADMAESGQEKGGDAPAKGDIKLPTGPVKLVIASFEPSEELKQAVKKYEQAHPNVTIDLQVAQTEFKSLDSQVANIEKYVTATNTALLSGKGPDVMELDLLPKEKYVGRGLLADFNELMGRDSSFDKSDYFGNVLDNLQIDGGLYAMPMSFFPNVLIGDGTAIEKDGGKPDDAGWTWDDFAGMVSQLMEKGTYPHALAGTPDYMLSEMVSERYAEFVDEANRKASFDSPAFAELMEQVKKLFDDGVILDFSKAGSGGRGASVQASPKVNTYFQESALPTPMEYLLLMDSYDGRAKIYTKPHAQNMGPGGYFSANETFGINAASANKEQAWDFVKFMLSEQGAAAPNLSLSIENTGFPINKTAYDKQIQEMRDKGEVPGFKNGPAEADAFKVNQAALDQLDAIVTSVVHPVGQPSKISDIIVEESAAFFAGQKTAEAVAKLIQSKVDLYLNE